MGPVTEKRTFNLIRLLFICVSAGAVYLIYSPGLSGSFLFDDYPNLKALEMLGGELDWEGLKRYLLSGFSGPTGRPVSLLSFLFDANNWPTDPRPFKQTNILLHLVNGALLYFVISSLLRFLPQYERDNRRLQLIAAFCALVWVLHPLLVSTTLYVVQRMAMLPLTFTLIGLWAWVKVRQTPGSPDRWVYIKLMGIVAFTTLFATFSKENGALFPALILVVEYTLLSTRCSRLNPGWKFLFLVAPLILIIGYLIFTALKVGFFSTYGGRDFTPYERLLTQFRIVWEYLYNWFIPRINTTGIYHDTVTTSSGLFQPVSTILALMATVVLIVGALLWRKRYPLVSLAVLFFFVSQLIESTVVGLELKFEHRVYLGSIFLFVPLADWGARRLTLRVLTSVFLIVIIGLSSFTYLRAKLWGDFPSMVMVWAEKNPYSPRAQVELGKLLYEAGRVGDSLQVLESATSRIPNDWPLALTSMMVKCKVEPVTDAEKDRLIELTGGALYKATNFNVMQNLLDWVDDPDCKGLDNEFLVRFTESLLSYPRNQNRASLAYSQISYIQGVALLRLGDDRAFSVLRQSLESRSEPQKMMNIAAYLATYGYIAEARSLAVAARDAVVGEQRYGKALAETPELEDIDEFLAALDKDARGQ